jgi:hypothetical protein
MARDRVVLTRIWSSSCKVEYRSSAAGTSKNWGLLYRLALDSAIGVPSCTPSFFKNAEMLSRKKMKQHPKNGAN